MKYEILSMRKLTPYNFRFCEDVLTDLYEFVISLGNNKFINIFYDKSKDKYSRCMIDDIIYNIEYNQELNKLEFIRNEV